MGDDRACVSQILKLHGSVPAEPTANLALTIKMNFLLHNYTVCLVYIILELREGWEGEDVIPKSFQRAV